MMGFQRFFSAPGPQVSYIVEERRLQEVGGVLERVAVLHDSALRIVLPCAVLPLNASQLMPFAVTCHLPRSFQPQLLRESTTVTASCSQNLHVSSARHAKEELKIDWPYGAFLRIEAQTWTVRKSHATLHAGLILFLFVNTALRRPSPTCSVRSPSVALCNTGRSVIVNCVGFLCAFWPGLEIPSR